MKNEYNNKIHEHDMYDHNINRMKSSQGKAHWAVIQAGS